MVEKLRSALPRCDMAIRDFYVIDHAIQQEGLDPRTLDLLRLVSKDLHKKRN